MPPTVVSSIPSLTPDWPIRWRWWRRAAAVVYLSILTFGSLAADPLAWLRTKRTGPKSTWPPFLAWIENDKVQHAAAYGALTALLLGATALHPGGIVVLAALHGGVIEFLQRWSPPRTTDVLDWIADVTGVLLVLGIHFFLFRRRTE